MFSDFSFSSSNVLIDGKLQKGSLTIEQGKIQLDRESSPYRHYNMGNFYVLPGIIDLHGDGFERHLFPRPSAPVKHTIALKNLSNELIYNGITTAYLAQCYSWEGGYRSPEFTTELLTSLKILKNDFLPDLRLQIRFETHLIDEKKYLIDLIDQFNIESEKPLQGIVKYSDGTVRVNDLVGFRPSSEYEFIVDGKRLYRVLSNFITIKYEYQGDEEAYNPSWAQSS